MINAFMQARTGSTRLPNKVLKNLQGLPMFIQQAKRVQRAKLVDNLVIVTSTDESDDIIEQLCNENNLLCFRGSLSNVLSRYFHAELNYPCDAIVRITADCPVIDPELMDYVINSHLKNNNDYTSNCLVATYPDGLDIEVISKKALHNAYKYAEKPSELEHVTPYITSHPDKYKLQNIQSEQDLSAYRWTVDEPKDFELISSIYENLYVKKPNFNYQDILELLSHKPELNLLNSQIARNEGMVKSLKQDKEEGYE
ncbi:glycosyltransferase family protein [Pseudoalteromonas sp. MQS005]|jgi:spore coat polysaccharide biosynthesis protein SpsF|uniref:cytidylyltransferase domain-containing protein n=1 Tax=Pseudoalteromonas sp. MQS005 TaxID=1854052 RepID=UPI0007E4F779|nr:glycosyltransferase family protein [Pseudoalteromonas sp. MQS005]